MSGAAESAQVKRIGRGRPWVKGQSGNPWGRKPGTKTHDTLISEATRRGLESLVNDGKLSAAERRFGCIAVLGCAVGLCGRGQCSDGQLGDDHDQDNAVLLAGLKTMRNSKKLVGAGRSTNGRTDRRACAMSQEVRVQQEFLDVLSRWNRLPRASCLDAGVLERLARDCSEVLDGISKASERSLKL